MLDQTLYPKFSSDANNKQTSIYPIIVIGWDSTSSIPFNDAIYISTASESMTIIDESNVISKIDFIDADLKLSSIKESIDFESRKFKISNLTITFSNYSTLASILEDVNLMNKQVAVFYKSKSCKDLSDCLPIYIANVRRYDYTSKNIKIILEDNTQEKISKDIPIANVGTDPSMAFSEKYHNRYIPITYGIHDRAPAIAWPRVGYPSDFYVICDDVFNENRNIQTHSNNANGCLIKKGEYWRIRSSARWDLDNSYPNREQVERDDSFPYSWFYFRSDFAAGLPKNLIAANEVQGSLNWYPNSAGLIDSDGIRFRGEPNENWIWNGGIDEDEDHDVPEIIEISAPENTHDDPNDTNVFGELGIDTFARIPNNDQVSTISDNVPECDFSNGYDFSGTQFGEDYNPFKFRPRLWDGATLPRIKWDGNEEYMDYNNSQVLPLTTLPSQDSGDWHWDVNVASNGDNPGEGTLICYFKYNFNEEDWPRRNHLKFLYAASEVTAEPSGDFNTPTAINDGLAFIQLPSAKQIMSRIFELINDGTMESPSNVGGLNFVGNSINGYPFGNCIISGVAMDEAYVDQTDLWYGDFYNLSSNSEGGVIGSASPWIHSIGAISGDGSNWEVTHGTPHYFPDYFSQEEGGGGKYWGCPRIESASPSGNVFWLFGLYDEDAPDTSDTGNYDYGGGGGYGHSNNHDNQGNEYCSKFIKVSFDKNVSTFTGQDSRIVAEYSLFELFDLSKSPIVIPYEMAGTAHNWAEGANQGSSIKPTYNCYWNGIYNNNYDDGVIDDRGVWEYPYAGTLHSFAGSGEGSWEEQSDFAYARTYGPKDHQQKISSGTDKWFTINLSNWKGQAAGTLLTNYARAWAEHDGAYSGDVGVNAYFTGGTVQVTSNDDYMALRSPDEDEGRVCGIRFNLPELEIEDNIDAAMKVFWRRKINIGIDADASYTGNDNQVRMIAYANNSDRYEDNFEESKTDLGVEYTQWGFEDLIDLLEGTDGSNPHIRLNNIDYADNSGLPGDGEDELVSASGFNSDNNYYEWLYPDQYNSFMVLFKGAHNEGSTSRNILTNLSIYENYLQVFSDFKSLNESDFYIEGKGRYVDDILLENPADIVRDFLMSELNYTENIDISKFNQAHLAHNDWKYAFSVKDKINSKKLLEDFSRSTKFFPNFKGQKLFSFTSILDSYDVNDNYNMIIDINDILSYSYSKTKMEQVKSKVLIKYKWDYGNDKFTKNTGWVSAKDFLGDGDEGYVNPDGSMGYSLNYFNTTEEDTNWSFESKYIQNDRSTANKLSEFLVMWYCNQHTILNLKMAGFKYAFLEVGDIMKFDKLIEGKKIYGEDYTTSLYRNGQLIYPLFLITSMEKTSKGVNMSCIQLHKLEKEFPAPSHPTYTLGGIGDVNRDGVIEEAGRDLDFLTSYVNESIPKADFTRYQIKSMDINGSKSVNEKDVDYWPEWYEYYSQLLGWNTED